VSVATALRRHSLVAAALLLALGCQRAEDEELETAGAVPVVVEAARIGDVRAVVRAAGQVVPAPGAELVVVAPASARIAALPHAEGDQVARGDLLVRFDVPDLQADTAARRADRQRGLARLAAARASLQRLSGLFDRGIAARKEVEDARREVADAEADVATATSAQAAASAVGSRAEVRAPFGGVVTTRLHNVGDLVDAGAGDPVLRFVDPARLEVDAAVPFADLAPIAVGQAAAVRAPGQAVDVRGTVVARPAIADPTTGTGKVRIALAPGAALPANVPVEVAVETLERRGVVLVPAAAIVQEGPAAFVYVVTADNHAQRRAVELGVADGARVEVRRGITAGERVVVQGQTGLPDGAAVTIAPAGAGDAAAAPGAGAA
jgi:RND family efflux transporter MFP subunit